MHHGSKIATIQKNPPKGTTRGAQPDPYIRRSSRPYDITAWGPEEKMRFANFAELNGNSMADGAGLFVGAGGGPSPGRIDIIDPGGSYRWPAARQVVGMDTSSAGDPISGVDGNRFTKVIFLPSRFNANRLYAVWGWACRGSLWDIGLDCKGYSQDSHEVFFAYSDDAGLNWKNLDNTRSVAALLCLPSEGYCNDADRQQWGIRHNDNAYRITTTRQREKRAIWEDADGTIYIAFTKSLTHETPPGALMLLKFRLGGTVEERMVNPDPQGPAAIRKEGSTLYLWAQSGADDIPYEYSSTDEGATWQRTPLTPTYCGRLHDDAAMPARNMVSMVCEHTTSDTTSDI